MEISLHPSLHWKCPVCISVNMTMLHISHLSLGSLWSCCSTHLGDSGRVVRLSVFIAVLFSIFSPVDFLLRGQPRLDEGQDPLILLGCISSSAFKVKENLIYHFPEARPFSRKGYFPVHTRVDTQTLIPTAIPLLPLPQMVLLMYPLLLGSKEWKYIIFPLRVVTHDCLQGIPLGPNRPHFLDALDIYYLHSQGPLSKLWWWMCCCILQNERGQCWASMDGCVNPAL